jgi:hypothetical protein
MNKRERECLWALVLSFENYQQTPAQESAIREARIILTKSKKRASQLDPFTYGGTAA